MAVQSSFFKESNPMTYGARSFHCTNKTARNLLALVEKKKTNLVFNPDVTSKISFLHLVDQIGPEICMLKTHIDIIEDFDKDLIVQLLKLAKKHQFFIFEDRKFADIGYIVMQQYKKGMYNIVDWADVINAHIFPGPGLIEGLQKVGLKQERGLLLLAEMSTSGNFFTKEHAQKAIELGSKYKDFVIGFICRQKLSDDPSLIHITPGVKRMSSRDHLGQQYLTPAHAIAHLKTDLIIVGRGIYQASNPQEAAKSYRQEGWEAYLSRLRS